MRKGLVILGTIALAGGLIIAALLIVDPKPKSPPAFLTTSGTNAYEIFVAASKQLKGPNPLTVKSNFAEYVSLNTEPLARTRAALAYRSEAPMVNYDLKNRVNQYFAPLRELGYALLLSGKAAEEKSDWDKAAGEYLNVIRYGVLLEYGPMQNVLIGMLVEKTGRNELKQVLPRLSAEELATVNQTLLAINNSRVTIEGVKERERYFIALNSPNIVMSRIAAYKSKPMFQSMEEKLAAAATETAQLAGGTYR